MAGARDWGDNSGDQVMIHRKAERLQPTVIGNKEGGSELNFEARAPKMCLYGNL